MTLLLDRRAFDLREELSGELLRTLLKVHEDENGVKIFAKEAGMDLSRIEWKGTLTDIWTRALERAAAEGKLRKLVEVVSAHDNSSAHAIFKMLLTQEAPTGDADPCEALLLGSEQRPRAFIDRAKLRGTLRDMLTVGGGRVLIVDGDRGSGKTWTWYLLYHVLQHHGITPYKIDFSSYAEPVTVADIASELGDQLGWGLAPGDSLATEDAQARRVVNRAKWWMRGRPDPQDFWLVFDGMARTALTPAALRLVELLAEAVADGETGKHLSVVLIAYEGQLRPSAEPCVWRTRLGPIHVADLREFFCSVARHAGAVLEADAAAQLVTQVLGKTVGADHDPDTPLPLEKVSAAAGILGGALARRCGGAGV
ncbi:effector-associated domain EAD1-containing protein [Streptomyces erythrochromogenes]|uniref:effector-associated domain EAD1-containing protein n=1 Tax=Streptomyces erythrochromogenes TaxID=285574 RepID=UPI00386B701C|nr:effector-associated domain EAD1-containing protein [Streptomyces erythrochromogenes]